MKPRPAHSVRRSREAVIKPGIYGHFGPGEGPFGPLDGGKNRRNLLQRNNFHVEPPRVWCFTT